MNRIQLGLIGISLILSSLSVATSPMDDIFKNTDETRRPAKGHDFDMALALKGCAGFLIAPEIGASAAHCKQSGRLRSGMALKNGKEADGKIGRTIEIGKAREYDYWIFEIEWDGGDVPEGMEVVPSIQTKASELAIGDNEVADKIYTLGFPADIAKGKLIHSWGYAKSNGSKNKRVINNISLINGNSGGGIWRSSDDMLVSIVSGGPHRFKQDGWNDNDWNEPSHWNWGPALWQVYESSDVLQEVFRGGKNRYGGSSWRLERAVAFLPSFGHEFH